MMIPPGKNIDEKICDAFDTFKDLNEPGVQLERDETFIYTKLEERCGVVTPQKKALAARDRNMENLREKKNLLKSN